MTSAPTTTEHRSTLREAAGAVSAKSLAFALSLITGPILARSLGDTGRGEMAAVVVPVQLFGWMAVIGLPYAASQLIATMGRERLLRAAWLAAVVMLVLFSVPVAVFAEQLRPQLSSTSLLWFRIGFLLAPLSIPTAVTMRLRLVERGAGWSHGVTTGFSLYLFSTLVVVLAMAGQLSVSTAVAAWVLAAIAQPALVISRYQAARLPLRDSASDLQLATRVGAPFALGSISQVLLGRVDQVAMASTVSLEELGVYAVAATAAQATLPIARGIADTTFARQMRTLDANGLVKLTFALSAIASLVMAGIAPFVLPVLFGETFTPSVRLLQLLLPGQVAFNTGLVLAQRFDASGRPIIAGRSLALAAAVNVVLVVPVTSTFGPTGAAVLTTACQFLFAASILATTMFERRK